MNIPLPYYAVIFTSLRSSADAGYSVMAERMMELARLQDGFLGVDHARETIGITVSYWKSLDSIAAWKANTEHRFAQQKGREEWYSEYSLRICKVEREYHFKKP